MNEKTESSMRLLPALFLAGFAGALIGGIGGWFLGAMTARRYVAWAGGSAGEAAIAQAATYAGTIGVIGTAVGAILAAAVVWLRFRRS